VGRPQAECQTLPRICRSLRLGVWGSHDGKQSLRDWDSRSGGLIKKEGVPRFCDPEELRRAFAEGGERGYWQTQLEFLKADSKQSPADSYSFAPLYACVGDRNRTFQYLEKAFQEHSQDLTLWLLTEPGFDSVRTDPRFQDLLRRIGRTQ
jgi:hypothetical protein